MFDTLYYFALFVVFYLQNSSKKGSPKIEERLEQWCSTSGRRLKVLRVEENCLSGIPPAVLKDSTISTFFFEGNLFSKKDFENTDGHDEYSKRFTESRQKAEWFPYVETYFFNLYNAHFKGLRYPFAVTIRFEPCIIHTRAIYLLHMNKFNMHKVKIPTLFVEIFWNAKY